MPKTIKTVVFWLVIGISALLLWQVIQAAKTEEALPKTSYSQFISQVESGDVVKVTIAGSHITAQLRDGAILRTTGPSSQGPFLDLLHAKGVEIWFTDAGSETSHLQLLGNLAPLILLGALWFFMIRQMQKQRAVQNQSQQYPGANPPTG